MMKQDCVLHYLFSCSRLSDLYETQSDYDAIILLVVRQDRK